MQIKGKRDKMMYNVDNGYINDHLESDKDFINYRLVSN